jgi:hypothetical protein
MKHVLNRPFTAKARRKGVFLCVGGARKDVFFENARRLIKIFFGTLGIEYSGEVYYGGFGKNAAIMQEEEALKKAFELGKDLARAT